MLLQLSNRKITIDPEKPVSCGGSCIVYRACDYSESADNSNTTYILKVLSPTSLTDQLRFDDAGVGPKDDLTKEEAELIRAQLEPWLKLFADEFMQLDSVNTTLGNQSNYPHMFPCVSTMADAKKGYILLQTSAGITFEEWRGLHAPHTLPKHENIEVSNRIYACACVRLAEKVLSELQRIHEAEFLHLDIKPSNLWINTESSPDALLKNDSNFSIKILDFGSLHRTKDFDAPVPETYSTRILTRLARSKGFSSPSLYRYSDFDTDLAIDERCDRFSLVAVLLWLMTGETSSSAKDTITHMRFESHDEPNSIILNRFFELFDSLFDPAKYGEAFEYDRLKAYLEKLDELLGSSIQLSNLKWAVDENREKIVGAINEINETLKPVLKPVSQKKKKWIPMLLAGLVAVSCCAGLFWWYRTERVWSALFYDYVWSDGLPKGIYQANPNDESQALCYEFTYQGQQVKQVRQLDATGNCVDELISSYLPDRSAAIIQIDYSSNNEIDSITFRDSSEKTLYTKHYDDNVVFIRNPERLGDANVMPADFVYLKGGDWLDGTQKADPTFPLYSEISTLQINRSEGMEEVLFKFVEVQTDINGCKGYRLIFGDDDGRVSRIEYLYHSEETRPDAVKARNYFYNGKLLKMVQTEYMNKRIETEEYRYDDYNRLTALTVSDEQSPCIYLDYDSHGHVTKISYRDVNGSLIVGTGGYASVEYGHEGDYVSEICYRNTLGGLVCADDGWARKTIQHEEDGRIIERYFDSFNTPCNAVNDAAVIITQSTEDGQTIAYWDKDGKHIFTQQESVVSESVKKYTRLDEYGQVEPGENGIGSYTIETTENSVIYRCYSDDQNTPVLIDDRYCSVEYIYGAFGRIERTMYRSIHDTPSEGAARLELEYDDWGRMVYRRRYDKSGQFLDGPNEYTYCHYEYLKNAEGQNVLSQTYYHANAEPAIGPEGEHAVQWIYNDKGELLDISFFDHFGRLTFSIIYNYACVKHSYNSDGQEIEKAYYDENGEYSCLDNWARCVCEYDQTNLVKKSYYRNDTELVVPNEVGYASIQFDYDEKGRVVKETYFDEQGNPMAGPSGYAQIEFVFDENERIASESYYDINGDPFQRSGWYSSISWLYDEHGYVAEKTYMDSNGYPVYPDDTYASIRNEYDECGRIISKRKRYLDSELVEYEQWTYHQNGYTVAYSHNGQDPYEVVSYQLDENGRTKEKYMRSYHHGYKYQYEEKRGRISELAHINEEGALISRDYSFYLGYEYNSGGGPRNCIWYEDNDNDLFFPLAYRVEFAIMRFTYADAVENQVVAVDLLDEHRRPMRGTDEACRIEWEYDEDDDGDGYVRLERVIFASGKTVETTLDKNYRPTSYQVLYDCSPVRLDDQYAYYGLQFIYDDQEHSVIIHLLDENGQRTMVPGLGYASLHITNVTDIPEASDFGSLTWEPISIIALDLEDNPTIAQKELPHFEHFSVFYYAWHSAYIPYDHYAGAVETRMFYKQNYDYWGKSYSLKGGSYHDETGRLMYNEEYGFASWDTDGRYDLEGNIVTP